MYDVAALVLVGVLSFLYLLSVWRSRHASQVPGARPLSTSEQSRRRELSRFTKEEVARHNRLDDAWIVVQDPSTKEHKVYDITAYVPDHPGGYSILRNVGKDSTTGVYGPQHPPTVFDLLETYLIGTMFEPVMFTANEVAVHNRHDDAWIIVRDKDSGIDKVYDVTRYVEDHPGGLALLNNAGADSTAGFYGPQHPSSALKKLESYYIGYLEKEA